MKNGSLPQKILKTIEARKVVRRRDLSALGGYDQVGRAMRRLEAAGKVEKIGVATWRTISGRAPSLDHSRTWSRPSGVSDDILIAATLSWPSFEDIARLCVAFGVARVRRSLSELEAERSISPLLVEKNRRALDRIERGFRSAGAHYASR